MFVYVLFYLGQLSHFPSCFGTGVTNLNDPPLSFLLPPRYCGLGAVSIPLRAIVNNKQCEMRGYLCRCHTLLKRRCTRLPGVSTSEMTYIVSNGALNSTHSLTHLHCILCACSSKQLVVFFRIIPCFIDCIVQLV